MAGVGWQAYLPAGLTGPLSVTESVVAVGTTGAVLVAPNPNRVALILSGDGVSLVHLAMSLSEVGNGGLALTVQNPLLLLTAALHMILPTVGWVGIVATGTVNVYIVEVIAV